MDLSLRRLEVFVAVADRRHFSRAADALHLSQPVVSQEVKRLERQIGVQLFERTSRRVELTAAGDELYTQATLLLESVDRTIAKVREIGIGGPQTLRLVHTPSVSDETLPVLLEQLDRRCPEVRVQEQEVNTGGAIPELMAERADFALCRFVDRSVGVSARTVRQERLVAVLSDEDPAAGSETLGLDDLQGRRLVVWDRDQAPSYHDFLIDCCRRSGFEPETLGGSSRIFARAYQLRSDNAFMLLPESAVTRLPAGLVCRELCEDIRVPLVLAWRTGDHRAVLIRALSVICEVSQAQGWTKHQRHPEQRAADHVANAAS